MFSQTSFKKTERLKSRTTIAQLFSKGKSFGCFPLRLVWIEIDNPHNDYPIKTSFSVSKKKFKNAVDRNRIKRQMREAWRLNKQVLYDSIEDSNKHYAFMIIYTANVPLEYARIDKNMRKMIEKFLKTTSK